MSFEFLIHNSVGIVFLILAVPVLIFINLWGNKFKRIRYRFIFEVLGFALWTCIILLVGDYFSNLFDDLHIKYLTSATVGFVCDSIIALLFIRKLFLFINFFEMRQVNKGRDITDSRVISRVMKITALVITFLVYGQHFGMSFSGLLAFGGIGGIAVGMAGKDILSNFFSGIMLYFDRPFNIGDWIRSPDRNIEGVVAEIGWRLTKIMTFENRPMYIPNSVFADIVVENPGRMLNRRIETTVGLRYEDADKIADIVKDIHDFLTRDEDIDQSQTLLVYFNGFGDSSLNIMVYCFTHTTVWSEWLGVQQKVFMKIISIVHGRNADFAFPSSTIYLSQ
ncbi:mechanosensitive ion channel family protein [Raoultella planticola]|uniref:mechanosensitive ion channel family protein n=1 Tax=Raoultella planticola TaxID=575 RepID=UPI00045A999F|nr:mechanosensitive ion channel family protein [Raoultella planticola]KAJ96833.1 mechanosensitive ion channel protein MscS [Raoultella planticola]